MADYSSVEVERTCRNLLTEARLLEQGSFGPGEAMAWPALMRKAADQLAVYARELREAERAYERERSRYCPECGQQDGKHMLNCRLWVQAGEHPKDPPPTLP